MYIWDTRYELMTREEIEQFQLEKLQALLNRLYLNIPYYKRVFNERNITPQDIKTLSDIQRLPLMDKEVLRINQPYGLFAIPLREVVRFHSTSGTTGNPIAMGYSKNDIKHWSELVARNLTSAGVNSNDVIQIAFEYGLFTGGLGFHYGGELIGSSIIPVSNINPDYQLQIMRDYKSTVLLSTPTMALGILNSLENSSINKNELSLKIGIFGAEPWSEDVRKRLESGFNIKAYDTYGISELIGPGISGECVYQEGLHLNEDYFYAEIIDPDTLAVLRDGEEGELVLTSLNKEAFPLIRYRTKNITSINREKCKCGRSFLRLGRISKRSDDVVIVNGIKIYPEVIEKIIDENPNLGEKFLINIDRENGFDIISISIEIKSGFIVNVISDFMKISETIKSDISKIYNINPEIKLVEPLTLSNVKKRFKISDNR